MSSTSTVGHGADQLEGEPEPTRLGKIMKFQNLRTLLVLLAIMTIFTALDPSTFLTAFNIRGIVVNTSILAVLGVGTTLVLITGGIDLSVGSVLVFSGVVADKAMVAAGGQGWGATTLGIAVACVSGLAWGLLNGVLVAKAKVPPLIVTLGTLGAALGLAQIITNGLDLRNAPTVLVQTIGTGNLIGQLPFLSVIAALVVVIGIVLLHRTRFGLHTYAIGSNAEAGRRVGLRVDRHLILVYALAGLLAGFGGLLNLAFFQSTTIGGQSSTNLNVIAGAVIGGTSVLGGVGTIFGTVLGLFIPAVLQNGFVITGIQPFWQQVVVGAVLIAAVYLDQRKRANGSPGKLWSSLLTRSTPTTSTARKADSR
ncbi:ABC transporter permease [Streptomyces sp. RP5T]|uniref:ABC transporter permease n=1 Tax=Streptomyces sp. RP5T TaxID=2490848 RepID=UPI000F6504C3|nr:ABC transporter permease [Streptomyces sp. RP5T]RRR73074.1 ABC transporter permease [Streptomyces sp. RP5T]